MMRNKERNAMVGALRRKKGKGKSGPNILDDFNQDENQGDLKKGRPFQKRFTYAHTNTPFTNSTNLEYVFILALKLLDGGGKGGKGGAKYREIVWEMNGRGC
jgi:hypothetical protein